MFPTSTTYIGIDPTAGQRPFAYAALDSQLDLLALGQGNMDEVLAFLAGQRQAVVAISAPRRPNRGLLALPEVRQNLANPPRPGRWVGFRMAEYQLRQHNLTVPRTQGNEKDCPNWMRMGFRFYRRLEELGYHTYPDDGVPRQCLEVYPHACYAVLIGALPLPKISLEGRLQRQLILHDQKIKVPDPMRFFEEITRHRLLKGKLPLENLYSAGELDALIGAYTAWMAATHPDQVCAIGDPEEGQIVLPVNALKERY
jgi:hypothetical protein